jgi:hypothetical protein
MEVSMKSSLVALAIAVATVSYAQAQSSEPYQSQIREDQTSTVPQKREDHVAPKVSPSGSPAGSRSSGEMTQDSDGVSPVQQSK